MNTFIQIIMFPNHYHQQIRQASRAKRLPIERALDLFPRIERQLVFADYFPGFEPGKNQLLQDIP